MPLPQLHRSERVFQESPAGSVLPVQYANLATSVTNPPPSGQSPHNLNQQDIAASKMLPGPGRPHLELASGNQRAVIGVLLTTNLAEKGLTDGIRKVGGPARQYVRGFLGKVLGARYSRHRPKADAKLQGKREAEQNRAYEAYCQQALGGVEPEDQHLVGTDAIGEAAEAREVEHPKSAFSLGQLATVVDGGENTGFYLFLFRCWSLSKSTIASRLSTLSPCPCARTRNTDFRLHYYERERQDSNKTFVTASSAVPDTKVSSQSPTAVDIVAESWWNGSGDDAALNRLQAVLPQRKDEQLRFINVADHRGITALHLSTAYGYIRTCRFLISNSADHKARTVNNESIHTFSRPAKRLAKNNIYLFSRIVSCRENISMGKPPPEPEDTEMVQSDERKRPRKVRKTVDHGEQRGPRVQSQESQTKEGFSRSTTTGTASTYRSDQLPDARAPYFGSRFFDSPVSTMRPSVESFSNTHPGRSGFAFENTIRQTTTGPCYSRAPHPASRISPMDSMSSTMMVTSSGTSVQPFSAQDMHHTSVFNTGIRRAPRRRSRIYGQIDDPPLIPQYSPLSHIAGGPTTSEVAPLAPPGFDFNQLSKISPPAKDEHRNEWSTANMQHTVNFTLPELPTKESTSVHDFAPRNMDHFDPKPSSMQSQPAHDVDSNLFAGAEQFGGSGGFHDNPDYIALSLGGNVRAEPLWEAGMGAVPSPSLEDSQWVLPPRQDSRHEVQPQGQSDRDLDWSSGNRQFICASCGDDTLCNPCWELFLQRLDSTAASQQ